jgi:hypothetical protein
VGRILEIVLGKNKKLFLFDVIFILAGIAIIVFGRWSSIIYPIPLNPDEVQMAANAIRII